MIEALEPSPELARIFDRYRQHYGARGDVAAADAWLARHMTSGALRAFLASRGGQAVGRAVVAPIPASHQLGHFWQLRDLFVAPDHRRLGVAMSLLMHLRDAARADGATRLSLITESENTAALTLYAAVGMEVVTGHVSMSCSTRRDAT